MFKESASIGHILPMPIPMPIPPKIADTSRCRLIGTSLVCKISIGYVQSWAFKKLIVKRMRKFRNQNLSSLKRKRKLRNQNFIRLKRKRKFRN